jgi:hypothetical protein
MVNEKPLKLDMPFEEALERFVRTDEREIPERRKLKHRKRTGGRSPPAKVEDQAASGNDASDRARTRRGNT